MSPFRKSSLATFGQHSDHEALPETGRQTSALVEIMSN